MDNYNAESRWSVSLADMIYNMCEGDWSSDYGMSYEHIEQDGGG